MIQDAAIGIKVIKYSGVTKVEVLQNNNLQSRNVMRWGKQQQQQQQHGAADPWGGRAYEKREQVVEVKGVSIYLELRGQVRDHSAAR